MYKQEQTVLVKCKDTSFQLSTDDADLAELLSSSANAHAAPRPDGDGALQHKSPADLRQRGKPQTEPERNDSNQQTLPEQLAEHLHQSPFIDTDSCMTAYEWVKFAVMLPWLLFRIVVATPLLIIAWSSTALLVAGVPVNTPLPKWRRSVVSSYLK